MPKLPNKLSDEELAKILEQKQEDTEETPEEDEIVRFIATFGLSEGTVKIPLKLVYNLYKRWSSAPMGDTGFNKKLLQLLPNTTIIRGKVHLLLNKSTLNINEELFRLVSEKKVNKERSDYFKKHFDNFLKTCNIEVGNNWVSCKSLHNYYFSWSKKSYKKNPLGYKYFEALCKLYFPNRNKPMEVAINKKELNAAEEKIQT
ncbi:MAG: hypothetical protein HC836_47385 [Richelia sp. RM2_1_2]|nr:hypothetical protein [Richelia sp. RM2_1_2]